MTITTEIANPADAYNSRLMAGEAIAKTWRTARPGHENYKLRVSGKLGITLNDTFWFASANERSLWAIAHIGNTEHPNKVGAEPQFLMRHVNGWSDPEADQDFDKWLRVETCDTHGAILTPMVPGEPGLECGMCTADHDAQ